MIISLYYRRRYPDTARDYITHLKRHKQYPAFTKLTDKVSIKQKIPTISAYMNGKLTDYTVFNGSLRTYYSNYQMAYHNALRKL
jgi:hypothetical protein